MLRQLDIALQRGDRQPGRQRQHDGVARLITAAEQIGQPHAGAQREMSCSEAKASRPKRSRIPASIAAEIACGM